MANRPRQKGYGMKTFNLKLEFEIISTEYADATVEAETLEDAIKIVKENYYDMELDFYDCDYYESRLVEVKEEAE
jgi:hypothetical protein